MILRPHTVDECVYNEVIRDNCYRVPDKFNDGDIVIDIGAHIGCFSKLCADRGAQAIFAYELNRENFELANENLKDYNQIFLFNRAVWKESGLKVGQSGMYMTADGALKNTGSSHVAIGTGYNPDIETITIDDMLDQLPRVAILKLDCEGAEFEIIPSVKDWSKVDRLVGEVHGYRKEYSVPDFYMEVKKHFPNLEVCSHCSDYGLDHFFAWK